MAKKVKQKKAGMLKRKQQKRKNKENKRKVFASRAVQPAQNSKRYLESLFQELPRFAFDERFDDMRLNVEDLKELKKQGDSDPLILMKLITPEVLSELEQRLVLLDNETAPRSRENMLAKACLHQIERSHEIPHLSNPMIVAIYLRSRAEALGEVLEVSDIHDVIEAYEEDNKEMIDRLSEDPQLLEQIIQASGTAASSNASQKGDEDIEDGEIIPEAEVSDPPVPHALFEEYKATWAELAEKKQESLEEDLEVFLEDFNPASYENWNADLIRSFLEDWCMANLNPLEEDLWSMQETILHFLRFMAEKKLVSESFTSEIIPRLEDREACKSLFQN